MTLFGTRVIANVISEEVILEKGRPFLVSLKVEEKRHRNADI